MASKAASTSGGVAVDKARGKELAGTSGGIQPPDKHELEKAVAVVTEQINAKLKLIEQPLVADSKDINDQLQVVGGKLDQSEEERRRIASEIKSIDENIRQLGAKFSTERGQANKLVASLKYKTEDMYDEQIAKLETQLQSSHFSLSDQRKLQQTVENLREAKLKLKDYLLIRETMNQCRAEQDALRKRKDSLHQRNKICREKSTGYRDDMERLRKDLDERKLLQKEKKSEHDAITKEINDLYQKRKQLNDDFRQKQAEYLKQLKASSAAVKEKLHVPERPVERQYKLLVRPAEHHREAVFEEQKAVCRKLMNYLSRINGSSPLLQAKSYQGTSSPSPTSQSPETTPAVLPRSVQLHAVAIAATATDRDGEMYQKRGDDEEEWMPAAQRSRKDRRKSKRERRRSFSGLKPNVKSLQHNATIFEQFSFLGLRPPITSADIPVVLDQLKNLMIHYERTKADSDAGDSGIMSSTGISEFSDIGNGDPGGLTSGEVTPNPPHPHCHSPSPPPYRHEPIPTIEKPNDSDVDPVHLDPSVTNI